MRLILPLLAAALLGACSKHAADNVADANLAAVATPTPTPSPSDSPTALAGGFDVGTAPTGQDPTSSWPYFGIRDGYAKATKDTAGYGNGEYLNDDSYDRVEHFDGTKLIPVEARTAIIKATGGQSSFFEIQKTYEQQIKALGGVTVYEGVGKDANGDEPKFRAGDFRDHLAYVHSSQMGVYMVKTPTKQVWVEVYKPWADDSKDYWLIVQETKPFEVKVQAIEADKLKSALDASGHVAVYFTFDTDRTAIKPDDQAQIAQIVKLMTDSAGLKLSIEGHTDNAGSPDHNQTLSLGRANAVMGSLIAAGIDPGRLVSKGFGATKPVADNATEDGKAKNRRVELVKR